MVFVCKLVKTRHFSLTGRQQTNQKLITVPFPLSIIVLIESFKADIGLKLGKQQFCRVKIQIHHYLQIFYCNQTSHVISQYFLRITSYH